MFGVSAVSLVATIVLTESVDTNLSSHVYLVGDGGSAVVEPVTVDGGKLFGTGGLDVRSPLQYIIIKIRLGRQNHTRSAST